MMQAMPMSMPSQSENPETGDAGKYGRGQTGLPSVSGSPKSARHVSLVSITALLMLFGTGCVSQGDFLRLQERVAESHARDSNAPDPFARIAQLSSDVDSLREEVRDLQGELELARKEAADALAEVRQTRSVIAEGAAASNASAEQDQAEAQAAAEATAAEAGPETARDQELASYQEALELWRGDNYKGCIDRFTSFLQAYPKSGYADDAAYWLADCTYKNDEFKRAVVRFNAVVSVYPDSPKAPDALYRQGESLLKLGPKFHEAARTVFKNVQKEYPDSKRATEAAEQLERLGAG